MPDAPGHPQLAVRAEEQRHALQGEVLRGEGLLAQLFHQPLARQASELHPLVKGGVQGFLGGQLVAL